MDFQTFIFHPSGRPKGDQYFFEHFPIKMFKYSDIMCTYLEVGVITYGAKICPLPGTCWFFGIFFIV